MKTYIVLPYKDRRGKFLQALSDFINPFKEFLKSNIQNEYELIIVEQEGGSLKNTLPAYYDKSMQKWGVHEDVEFFNMGRTINVGFDLLKHKMNDNDIFVFHPIDLLPPNDSNYNFSCTTKIYSNHYVGYWKALAFSVSDYKIINGFSNKYWGWGLIDLDLDARLNFKNLSCNSVFYDYLKLCSDGNHLEDESLFAPLNDYNYSFLHELNVTRNCEISGLSNLDYKLLSVDDFYGIKKFKIL